EKDVLLESFLLHFRNLRALLCPRAPVKDDDIVGTDFLREDQSRDIGDWNVLGLDKERLDKMLAHLTYSRQEYIEEAKDRWPVPRMLRLMLEQIQTFLNMLSSNERAWFPDAEWIASKVSLATYRDERTGRTFSTTSPSVLTTTTLRPLPKDRS